MSEKTKIQWADSTVNFWSGCTKVSPGCANCYAEAMDKRHLIEDKSHWGNGAPRLKGKGAVKLALSLNRQPWICNECGEAFTEEQSRLTHAAEGSHYCCAGKYHRRRIFSLSRGDIFDSEVPIEMFAEAMDTIRQCADVTWILCTKRPENWRDRLCAAVLHFDKDIPRATLQEGSELLDWVTSKNTSKTPRIEFLLKKLTRLPTALWIGEWLGGKSPKNIILLASVENQEQADQRISELLKIPAAVRGLSLEPLLAPVDLSAWISSGDPAFGKLRPDIDWIIIGGESGPGARPCNIEWIRSLVAQGKAAGVATFVKQLGANAREYGKFIPVRPSRMVLNDKKGGDISEWPQDLRIQQWPL